MSAVVVLHIGLPKSGTSYLQRLLGAHREPLQREGVLFPGRDWSDQVAAVRDVRGIGPAEPVEGAWQRLADEVRRWPDRAVISMEWLCNAEPRVVRRIVADLAPATVEVVVTVRDLGRTLPAAWQEFTQNQATWTWEEFLDGVTSGSPLATPAGRAFWSQQDAPRVVERWASAVTPERVHLVTLPHPGADRDLLWHRFAEVIGVDPSVCSTRLPPANESLGLQSAELMRRINARTRDLQVPRPAYNRIFKHHLAKTVLARRRAEESVLGLPAHLLPWLDDASERQRAALAASGASVVGDLAELRPVPVAGDQPGDLPLESVLDAAVAVLVDLARERDQAQRSSSRRRRRPRPRTSPRPAPPLRSRTGQPLVRRVRARAAAWRRRRR